MKRFLTKRTAKILLAIVAAASSTGQCSCGDGNPGQPSQSQFESCFGQLDC